MRKFKRYRGNVDKTMLKIKTGEPVQYAHIPHNSHGGKRAGAGRKKIDPRAKKRPVTTWLTPKEIKHLVNMGKDAQDGIRTLVHRLVGAKKNQRSDQSMTEILYLPLESERMTLRRLTKSHQ
jgi:hypothetical protein